VATELVQTEIKVATLEADNKALKSDIENLNLKNNIAELEIQKLKSQVEDLETANAELTSSINNLEGTFDPLVESIEIIEEDMENLMIWQNGTEEVIIELQESIEAVDDFNDRIEQNEIDIEIIYSANFTDIEEELENLNFKHDELRNDFNSFTVDISKWQIDTDRRIADTENDISDLFELTTGSTTIKPNTTTTDSPNETTAISTTAPSGECSNTPEDTLDCEHGCDTLIFECLSYCNHNTGCMAQCWRDKDPDYCKNHCPCNRECPTGCPDPFEGHPCDSWFCQSSRPEPKVCFVYWEDRVECGNNAKDQTSCESADCCWEERNDPFGTPNCFNPKEPSY